MNYIIVGADGFYNVAYHDLFSLENVRYFTSYLDGLNRIESFLTHVNFSEKVNKYVHHPLGSFSYKRIFNNPFDKDEDVCYIIFSVSYLANTDYPEYIKKHNPKAKVVLYFQDIVASYHGRFDFAQLRKRYDLLISYDANDAERYDMLYYPTPFSLVDIETDATLPESDVYFLGRAKTRYNEIFEVYRQCKKANLKCDFHIFGVPESKRILADDIVYDVPMTYIQNLQRVLRTKCVLEIMQEGAVGFTPRLWETIAFDKHLLTNNEFIKRSSYYDSSRVHIVDKNMSFSWIKQQIENSKELKKKMSPCNLLYFIEQYL